MPRCSTCALLFREPWLDFVHCVGGAQRAESFHHAAVIGDGPNPLDFLQSVYCFGEEPQFVRQLGTELAASVAPIHELFAEDHDCRFHQLASGHVSREDTILRYQQMRAAMNAPQPTVVSVVNNSGIVNVQSVLRDVQQTISGAPSLSEDMRKQLQAMMERLMMELAKTPATHAEQAEVAAEQAKEIATELQRSKPRDAALKIKGSGLVEAAYALKQVVPAAIGIAKQIAEFIANPAG